MIKKLTTYLDYSFFAELALVIFAAVFVAVVVRTLLTAGKVTKQQANILFDEQQEERS